MKTTSFLTAVFFSSLAAAVPAGADYADYDSAEAGTVVDGTPSSVYHNRDLVYQTAPDTFTYSSTYITHYSLVQPGLTTARIHCTVPPWDGANPNATSTSSSAVTSWFDDLTIHNPAYTGQTGTLSVDVRFDADISWLNVYGVQMQDQLYVNGNQFDLTGGISNSQGDSLQEYYPGAWSHHQTYTLTVTFVYGQSMRLAENTRFDGEPSNHIDDTYGNYDGAFTSAWLGNLKVIAPNSSRDTAYTISSSSGRDYSKPLSSPPDFNGDGKADYLLFKPSTRETAIWHLNDSKILQKIDGPTLPAGWSLVATGDFNGDGRLDYVLYRASNRHTAVWYMKDSKQLKSVNGPALPDGWTIAAVADFDGDGQPDYLLFDASTSRTKIWYLDGGQSKSQRNGPKLPAGWTVTAAADFNLDGDPDYLIFNPTTRQTAIWTMNNNVFVSALKGKKLPAGETLLGAADFNGDGPPDYVLFNPSTRRTTIWHLNVEEFVDAVNGPTLPAGWTVAAH